MKLQHMVMLVNEGVGVQVEVIYIQRRTWVDMARMSPYCCPLFQRGWGTMGIIYGLGVHVEMIYIRRTTWVDMARMSPYCCPLFQRGWGTMGIMDWVQATYGK